MQTWQHDFRNVSLLLRDKTCLKEMNKTSALRQQAEDTKAETPVSTDADSCLCEGPSICIYEAFLAVGDFKAQIESESRV